MTFTREYCSVPGCRSIVTNKTHRLCKIHNDARILNHMEFQGHSIEESEVEAKGNAKTTSAFIKTLPVKKSAANPEGFKSESELFDWLWNNEPHVSFISGKPINIAAHSDLWYNIFIHVLSKAQNKYPKFKLYHKNIVMGLPKEHELYDQGTEEGRKKYAELNGFSWQPLYDLADKLKIEYQK